MKKVNISLLLIFLAVLPAFTQSNPTPAQILAKTVSLISSSKGTEAQFSISNSGYTGKGAIKTAGLKYSVIMPDVEVWYNGKDLYTYNKRSGETTIVAPTSEEIAESNPLAYVTGAQKLYNVNFSTVKKAGKYVLELLPKDKGGNVKRVTLTLNKTNYFPEKIVVEPSSGNPISCEIISFKTGIATSVADFEYPKTKYPKAEIVDLR